MSDKKKEEVLEKEELEMNENETNKQEEQKGKAKHKDMVPKQDYDELDDRYKRILAEFENFKKRRDLKSTRLNSSH